jgi:ATP-binding cassette subfamily F protein uup
LDTQIAELNVVLADPDLYARDPARFGATTVALAVARDELAVAEEQWLNYLSTRASYIAVSLVRSRGAVE